MLSEIVQVRPGQLWQYLSYSRNFHHVDAHAEILSHLLMVLQPVTAGCTSPAWVVTWLNSKDALLRFNVWWDSAFMDENIMQLVQDVA